MTRPRRKPGRYGRPPHHLGAKRTRAILVEDALTGAITPYDWMTGALWYLGGRTSAGAEREFRSIVEEVASKGGVMPGAPTMPRSLP